MLGFLMKNPVMLKHGRATFQKLLDEVTTDKFLQAVLGAHSGTYGLSPTRASALIPLIVPKHYLNGAYYPKGGSGAFRDAFLNALRNHDTEMKNNARVVEIDKKGTEFSVKTESGETYTTLVVISDADPVITLGKLINPQIVPSKIRKKVEFLRPSLGALYAFIGTDLDLPSLGITDVTIHHHDDFDVNRLYEIMTGPSLEESVPFFFVTSPSVKDPQGGHVPSGRHVIEIATLISYSVFEKWSTSPSPDQMGPGRFGSFTAGVEGLFLVEAGTLGGGIMACVASGVLAGRKAAKKLGSSG